MLWQIKKIEKIVMRYLIDFESSASANSTTAALSLIII